MNRLYAWDTLLTSHSSNIQRLNLNEPSEIYTHPRGLLARKHTEDRFKMESNDTYLHVCHSRKLRHSKKEEIRYIWNK